jgi:redox-sensitive bicupin YhaK (pirin superfamily)
LLAVDAAMEVDGTPVDAQRMAFLGSGRSRLTVGASHEPAIAVLLGGEPFDEDIVMWWNFIGRSHEELVEQREAWNGSGVDFVPERFGRVVRFDGDRLLAPPLPNIRLKPRGRNG